MVVLREADTGDDDTVVRAAGRKRAVVAEFAARGDLPADPVQLFRAAGAGWSGKRKHGAHAAMRTAVSGLSIAQR